MNYAIYSGTDKKDRGPGWVPEMPQAFTATEEQAKHMAAFWGKDGYYECMNEPVPKIVEVKGISEDTALFMMNGKVVGAIRCSELLLNENL